MENLQKIILLCEKNKNVVTESYEIPKSFIVCENKKGERKLYISQLSPQTLSKRAEQKFEIKP